MTKLIRLKNQKKIKFPLLYSKTIFYSINFYLKFYHHQTLFIFVYMHRSLLMLFFRIFCRNPFLCNMRYCIFFVVECFENILVWSDAMDGIERKRVGKAIRWIFSRALHRQPEKILSLFKIYELSLTHSKMFDTEKQCFSRFFTRNTVRNVKCVIFVEISINSNEMSLF